ncbi:hypothetical protein BJF78_15355 [Pseudonocardia sp. CNS-139]|nr:hypothetical protein BJF78_15355 [Pseudonocardia sp. CNS-139]
MPVPFHETADAHDTDAADPAVAGAVARLTAEFTDAIGPTVVRRVVRHSRSDLSGCPPAALPELVERLARQRLLQSGRAAER